MKMVWKGEHELPNLMTLLQGAGRLWCICRPGFSLLLPPLPRLTLEADQFPDLSAIVSIQATGQEVLYLDPTEPNLVMRFNLLTHQRTSLGQLSPHFDLGRDYCTTDSGFLLAISRLSLDILNKSGKPLFSDEREYFEAPADATPFWKIGADRVAANARWILLSGYQMNRVDIYTWHGKYVGTIGEHFDSGGEAISFESERIVGVSIDSFDRVYVVSATRLFVFSLDGRVLYASQEGELEIDDALPYLNIWFGIDEQLRLWCHSTNGYAAFQVPNLQDERRDS